LGRQPQELQDGRQRVFRLAVARDVPEMLGWGKKPNAPSEHQLQMMRDHSISHWHFGQYDAVQAHEIKDLQQLFQYETGPRAEREKKTAAMDAKVLKNWNTAKEDRDEWVGIKRGLYISHKTEKLEAKHASIGVKMGGGLNTGLANRTGLAFRQGYLRARMPWGTPNLPTVTPPGEKVQWGFSDEFEGPHYDHSLAPRIGRDRGNA
jgi:hypothetical protein